MASLQLERSNINLTSDIDRICSEFDLGFSKKNYQDIGIVSTAYFHPFSTKKKNDEGKDDENDVDDNEDIDDYKRIREYHQTLPMLLILKKSVAIQIISLILEYFYEGGNDEDFYLQHIVYLQNHIVFDVCGWLNIQSTTPIDDIHDDFNERIRSLSKTIEKIIDDSNTYQKGTHYAIHYSTTFYHSFINPASERREHRRKWNIKNNYNIKMVYNPNDQV